MEKRKKSREEFKREAVGLANEEGVSAAEVARALGVPPGLLYRWRKDLGKLGGQAFLGQGNARDEEMTRLKRELARVKKERDFLRDAAAYFAKTSD